MSTDNIKYTVDSLKCFLVSIGLFSIPFISPVQLFTGILAIAILAEISDKMEAATRKISPAKALHDETFEV